MDPEAFVMALLSAIDLFFVFVFMYIIEGCIRTNFLSEGEGVLF